MKLHSIPSSLRSLSVLLGLAVVAYSGSASGQTTQPRTISKPGLYSLASGVSLRNSGDAITITASNVVLDLRGRLITTRAKGQGSGIVIRNAKNVKILNGKLNGFNSNVYIENSENVEISDLAINGDGLAPNGGPTEIGILIVNSRACRIHDNLISSVNLGLFVRGGQAGGNRLMDNVIVGGATAANNLLGVCYNPAPAVAGVSPGPAGPRGDSIYNNHVARFGFAFAVSDESLSNIFTDNTSASFTGAFREPQNFAGQGGTGTNVEFDNAATVIPAEDLP